MTKKKRVLFFCKHNSCRSQMAEASLKYRGQGNFDVYSAGLTPEPIRRRLPVIKMRCRRPFGRHAMRLNGACRTG